MIPLKEDKELENALYVILNELEYLIDIDDNDLWLISMQIDTVEKFLKFEEWLKGRMDVKQDKLNATAVEIMNKTAELSRME